MKIKTHYHSVGHDQIQVRLERRTIPQHQCQLSTKCQSSDESAKQFDFKLVKIVLINLVGVMLFGFTGGLIAPALLRALNGIDILCIAFLAASRTHTFSAIVERCFAGDGGEFILREASKLSALILRNLTLNGSVIPTFL